MNVREIIRSWSDLRHLYLKMRPYCDDGEFDAPLWEKEDLPKLKPFFDYESRPYDKRGPMSAKVAESFEYCKKCEREYALTRAEMRDALSKFTRRELADALRVNTSKSDKTYPYVIVGTIECSFDRLGNYQTMMLYEVHQSEFEKKQKKKKCLGGGTADTTDFEKLQINQGDLKKIEP